MDNHVVIMAGGIGSLLLADEHAGMSQTIYRRNGMWTLIDSVDGRSV